jgi:hypothetical protein
VSLSVIQSQSLRPCTARTQTVRLSM